MCIINGAIKSILNKINLSDSLHQPGLLKMDFRICLYPMLKEFVDSM